MKKQEALQLVKTTFNGKFEEQSFQIFIANLLKNYTPLEKVREGQYIREAFRNYILKYKIVGTFLDTEKNSVDILQVILHKEGSLGRARTAQRNFVADYLKHNGKNAALVAFITPTKEDWRFSLVKLEYSLEVKEGKLKTNEEITPAKRWSFLVGKNEGFHTVQSRFISLLESNQNPNLAELEEAFNIEKVTNEFFTKYCDLFYRMKESLDSLMEKDPVLKADFEKKEISTVDFAKKTLGQMAFLYFLQKKGWFGVAPEEAWGKGTKNFLRELFTRREKYGKNFFDDVLEPLFYEALAQDRGKESIYPRLNNCRMPFLNGGLFEPMNGYAWETTHINLPDELFSNTNKTKEGDTGDGILDVFDRYNFTVNENEPLEKEVAVDPEMLGKVFENLLEIKDRKSKGAFYTPREIVHYMCQESLINYLHSEAKESIPREDIELFIQKGDLIIQNDKTVLEKGRETDTYKFILPKTIREKAKELDQYLENIKVCDPAVGSGAFPLGMLNEVVRARQALGIHTRSTLTPYDLKLHTISNSIYGVDIDSGAVEIAKLRMWLALVVEEKDPHPLPNLEHKIMQGNSLISDYEGIKLFDDSFLEDSQVAEKEKTQLNEKLSSLQREYFDLHAKGELTPVKKTEIEKEIRTLRNGLESFAKKTDEIEKDGLFDAPSKKKVAQEKTRKLQSKIEQFISESRRSQKQALKEEIDDLKWELIEVTLEEQGRKDKLEEIRKLRRKNIRPFFIWKLEFSDVFKDKGGFDVVIGNPPYVGEKGNKDIFRPIAKGNLGKFHQGKMDLFYFFFHLALDLGRENTQNAFITTNYYITATGGKKLREDLRHRATMRNFINFNELKIFESALGQHNMITIFSKGSNDDSISCNTVTRRTGIGNENILKNIVQGNDQESLYFKIKHKDIFDGADYYVRINGGHQSDCPIDQILNRIKKAGDILGSFANINKGFHSGCDRVTNSNLKKVIGDFNVGDGIFVLTEEEVKRNKLENEDDIVHRCYKSSDISKWYSKEDYWKNLYVIYTNKHTPIEKYPNCNNHLSKYRPFLEMKREYKNGLLPWFSQHWPRDEEIFTRKQKIILPYRPKTNIFSLADHDFYASEDVLYINVYNSEIFEKYVLSLLNSKLYFLWLYHRGKRKGEALELYTKPLSEVPIKKISPEAQKPFINIVDQILEITSAPDYDPKKPPIRQKELEAKIDEMVFDLYELTKEEREIVLKN